MNTVVCPDDSSDVRTVKSSRCVIIRACVILSKVPATDHFVSRSVTFAQRHMIERNAAINDRDGLSLATQSELRVNLIPTCLRMCFTQMLFDRG